MKQYLRIHPSDTVLVALQPLTKGMELHIDGDTFPLLTDIPAGHKCALKDHAEGENVIKYGFPIGHTLHAVKKGTLLDHNDLQTNLSGTLDYSHLSPASPDIRPSTLTPTSPAEFGSTSPTSPADLAPTTPSASADFAPTFLAYPRPDGQVGIRNEVWVIPTVGCVNGIIQQIIHRVLAEFGQNTPTAPTEFGQNIPGIDGIHPFPHNYGCSQLSGDHENTRKILRDMVHHPNAGAILVVGLGCENNQPHLFEQYCGDYNRDRVKFMVCQEVEGDEVEYGAQLLKELIHKAQQDRRQPVPLSKLRIGLKCGGSDGFSGITANPLLGAFSDYLCLSQGGTTVLTEVPEMFGAETLLMQRCASQELLQQTIALINDFKEYFLSHGEPCGENPSPGNKAGGISTLEEKALGCTQKSGSSPVRGVLSYGDRLERTGLHLLSAPGNDLVASTALAAAGCQLILFTTGRGTPFGTFVPTVKVSTNSLLAHRKPHWIDFDAGPLLEDHTMDQLLPQFIQTILDVASGQLTASERAHIHDLAIFKTGVTL